MFLACLLWQQTKSRLVENRPKSIYQYSKTVVSSRIIIYPFNFYHQWRRSAHKIISSILHKRFVKGLVYYQPVLPRILAKIILENNLSHRFLQTIWILITKGAITWELLTERTRQQEEWWTVLILFAC